ncbi:MAG TPA: hypothetical protein VJ797_02170, partial [Burkholderiales bacterium]|nr:hypothetical protein [Burkholderiales bacterium]
AARLLASREFRNALAETAPGREAELAPAGTFNDLTLRAHELFKPDEKAPARRSLRYTAAAVVVVLALIGGGVSWRNTNGSQQPFVDAMLAKYPYWKSLVQRVRY